MRSTRLHEAQGVGSFRRPLRGRGWWHPQTRFFSFALRPPSDGLPAVAVRQHTFPFLLPEHRYHVEVRPRASLPTCHPQRPAKATHVPPSMSHYSLTHLFCTEVVNRVVLSISCLSLLACGGCGLHVASHFGVCQRLFSAFRWDREP